MAAECEKRSKPRTEPGEGRYLKARQCGGHMKTEAEKEEPRKWEENLQR